MDAADIAALASPDGERLLNEVADLLDASPELAVLERVGERIGPQRATAAVAQVTLRRKAATKFGHADASRMFFTPTGLEQASRARVATHRARTATSHVSAGTVTDLGCGLGADLIAFARAGFDVVGVERDPLTAACADANLRALGLSGRIEVGDATTYHRAPGIVFCDPARRNERGRIFDLAAITPPWTFVLDLLADTACVKVGPGIAHRDIPSLVGDSPVSAEWVSDNGTVTEACLRSGALAERATTRAFSATVLTSDRPLGVTLTGDPSNRAAAGPVAQYLYEPVGAVIRAGIVGTLTPTLGDAYLIDEQIAYLTSDRLVDTPFARAFRIVDEIPHRPKPLRAELRKRSVGTLTIKKRGVDLDPASLRRDLLGAHGYGNEAATIVITRRAGRGIALLVEPISIGPTSATPPT